MGAPNQLSFLPDDYLERKAQRRTNAVCAILFIVVMGGVIGAFMFREKATRRAHADYARVEAQYLMEAKRIEQVRQMQEKQKRMAHQAELTASLLERIPRSYILAEITNCMPAGLSLLEFEMVSKPRRVVVANDEKKTAYERKKASRQAAATPATPKAEPKLYDVSMKVAGLAMTDMQVAQFLNRLSRSHLFDDVNLSVTEEFKQGDDRLRKFQIVMMLDGDAEVKLHDEQDEAIQTTSVELKE